MQHYTLVQHSAYVMKNDYAFKHAVEERAITEDVVDRIRKQGGLILYSYEEARSVQEDVNYPPTNLSLLPLASGEFEKIKGMSVFIPK